MTFHFSQFFHNASPLYYIHLAVTNNHHRIHGQQDCLVDGPYIFRSQFLATISARVGRAFLSTQRTMSECNNLDEIPHCLCDARRQHTPTQYCPLACTAALVDGFFTHCQCFRSAAVLIAFRLERASVLKLPFRRAAQRTIPNRLLLLCVHPRAHRCRLNPVTKNLTITTSLSSARHHHCLCVAAYRAPLLWCVQAVTRP